MPELPEVETVRSGMEQSLLGRVLDEVCVHHRVFRVPVPDDFEARLIGARFTAFRRRGKYIIIDFDQDGLHAVLHLGMSGRVRIHHGLNMYEAQKHDHIVMRTQGGIYVVYHDPRRFGMFYTTPHGMDIAACAPFAQMGPEPLEGWDGAALYAALRSRKAPIKAALLDQAVVAGLGNIYVCEALFGAGIHPQRSASSLSRAEAERLAQLCIDVLRRAIKAGGSTLKDYQHIDGELGYFQHGFVVYDREGCDCPSAGCGEKILRIVQSGRSTFYCPACQK